MPKIIEPSVRKLDVMVPLFIAEQKIIAEVQKEHGGDMSRAAAARYSIRGFGKMREQVRKALPGER
jgi:ribosomal protein S9